MRAWVLALLAALAFGEAGARADPRPLPAFLPPRNLPESGHGPTKKDPHARAVAPAVRDTLCTIYNLHTGEALAIGAEPTPDEPRMLARLFRDRTNWQEHGIDPLCVATLRRAAARFGARRVEVISGYRSDKLNEHLRKKGRHVASRSQHVLGRAVDFRLVGVETVALQRFVRANHPGGVGFYPQSGFVHVDAGPRRQWRGE